MAIVTADRFNRFLGSPHWRDDQQDEAAALLEEIEDSLADRLDTRISPTEYAERAPVLRSGLVATRYPVTQVTELDGTDVSTGLPDGWEIRDHYLRQLTPGYGYTAPLSTLGWGWESDPAGRTESIGSVELRYQAGLGDMPALRKAILRKASAYWANRQDETVTVRDLDATQPPNPVPEEWTADEIENLSRYRNLHIWR